MIARYAAVLGPARVGLPLQAFVLVALERRADEVVVRLHKASAERPEVLAAYAISGETDYLLHVLAADLGAYGEFALKVLLRMQGLKERRSSFTLQALKPAGKVPA